MAVSPPDSFPPRKRRPGYFFPDKNENLLHSLLLLSKEISSFLPHEFLLRRTSASAIRKTRLLSVLFEDLLQSSAPVFPPSAALCFEELFLLIQRIKSLLEDCFNSSNTWLLIQSQSVSASFHDITLELSTILDVFPAGAGNPLNLCRDVRELVGLIRKQCFKEKGAYHLDPEDEVLRQQVLEMLETIKEEIVPDHSKLAHIFESLGLRDSAGCRDEMESLEEEVVKQTDPNSKSRVVALIGLVRYGKCVLYGASTPSSGGFRRSRWSKSASFDLNHVPADFRCPISLDLMRDPVVVATGQTYDRQSIVQWIESGHETCPKTGQRLAHTGLIPNKGLYNTIAAWCREQRIPFEPAAETVVKSNGGARVGGVNKAALEATKMTVSFLTGRLADEQPVEMANRIVHELRVLAKTDSDSRSCIAEAGALPLLVKFLGSEQPSLQVNAVTTILNLSILEANKTRIMETDGVLNGVIEVLRSGATWEAKGNAAATIFSLTGVYAYKKKLGRKTRVVKGLVELARHGPAGSKRDAMLAILNLTGDRESVLKLIEAGVVEMAAQVMSCGGGGVLTEDAVTILEMVVKKGGLMAVAAAYNVIHVLAVAALREGSDRARESAAATLVNMCRKGGSEMVAALAAVPGVERVIWEIMGMGGTARGRRKAATLLRLLRRWAAGLDDGQEHRGDDTSTTNVDMISVAAATSSTTSTRIILPG
ncbi:OLC1v1033970C1 [Oldenlandia corymbosa var. corymbosa]|uniref:RING-type E3 ubiquitin transferase n=1 Tax=Oldenlandia corymbosa var. corymbosa TaxID=529605 RepID=A0AAV1CQ63_OLDCO|nr:OLC1v1033970C1 [Oldenlandia corymbosa var. corymbosa]